MNLNPLAVRPVEYASGLVCIVDLRVSLLGKTSVMGGVCHGRGLSWERPVIGQPDCCVAGHTLLRQVLRPLILHEECTGNG